MSQVLLLNENDNGKKIYLELGSSNFINNNRSILLKLEIQKIDDENNINDFGNASSIQDSKIDYGNSNVVDYISKNFLFIQNQNEEQKIFDWTNSCEIIKSINIPAEIFLQNIIGYLYSIKYDIENKNRQYIIIYS